MIPPWLASNLANPPVSGAGVHGWLFNTARQLHAHLSPAEITSRLTAAVSGVGRHVTAREIADAVKNSAAVAWKPKGLEDENPGTAAVRKPPTKPTATADRWPAPCLVSRQGAIASAARDGVAGIYDLWEASPERLESRDTPDDWIDRLFPGVEWICLAPDGPETARTRLRHSWYFESSTCGLIVPSPMTAAKGKRLDGKPSPRCLDNTGLRRWLVIEFDSGAIDDQAALHWHLDRCAAACEWPRLTLCVHSGGKSLHGWYGPCQREDNSKALMTYARLLGADTAAWNRCQFVRLPDGRRDNAKLQPVQYYDPARTRVTASAICDTERAAA